MNEVFATRIKELREKQRKSRIVVSQLCGLNSDAFRKYERMERSPSADALVAIADYFEVSVDFLLGLSTDKRRRE